MINVLKMWAIDFRYDLKDSANDKVMLILHLITADSEELNGLVAPVVIALKANMVGVSQSIAKTRRLDPIRPSWKRLLHCLQNPSTSSNGLQWRLRAK